MSPAVRLQLASCDLHLALDSTWHWYTLTYLTWSGRLMSEVSKPQIAFKWLAVAIEHFKILQDTSALSPLLQLGVGCHIPKSSMVT